MKFLVGIVLLLALASSEIVPKKYVTFASIKFYSDSQVWVTGPQAPSGKWAVYCYWPSIWDADIQGAGWIWSAYTSARTAADEVNVFTRNFYIPGTPLSSTLRIAADDYYTVYVNDRAVGCSTTEATSSRPTQKACAIYTPLVNGANTLKIVVGNKGTVGSDPNPAGLLFSYEVSYAY